MPPSRVSGRKTAAPGIDYAEHAEPRPPKRFRTGAAPYRFAYDACGQRLQCPTQGSWSHQASSQMRMPRAGHSRIGNEKRARNRAAWAATLHTHGLLQSGSANSGRLDMDQLYQTLADLRSAQREDASYELAVAAACRIQSSHVANRMMNLRRQDLDSSSKRQGRPSAAQVQEEISLLGLSAEEEENAAEITGISGVSGMRALALAHQLLAISRSYSKGGVCSECGVAESIMTPLTLDEDDDSLFCPACWSRTAAPSHGYRAPRQPQAHLTATKSGPRLLSAPGHMGEARPAGYSGQAGLAGPARGVTATGSHGAGARPPPVEELEDGESDGGSYGESEEADPPQEDDGRRWKSEEDDGVDGGDDELDELDALDELDEGTVVAAAASTRGADSQWSPFGALSRSVGWAGSAAAPASVNSSALEKPAAPAPPVPAAPPPLQAPHPVQTPDDRDLSPATGCSHPGLHGAVQSSAGSRGSIHSCVSVTSCGSDPTSVASSAPSLGLQLGWLVGLVASPDAAEIGSSLMFCSAPSATPHGGTSCHALESVTAPWPNAQAEE